jgi:transposase
MKSGRMHRAKFYVDLNGGPDMQALHRVRNRLIGSRTQIGNQIRGLLAEYGIVLPQHLSYVRKALPQLTEESETRLSGFAKRLFTALYEELCALDQRIVAIEAELNQAFQQNALCQRISAVEGIGPVTATAVFGSHIEWQYLQQRAAVRSLAWARSPATLKWRKGAFIGNH